MKTIGLIILFISSFNFAFGQNIDTIQVFFLYGSKPAHGYRHTEAHLFGGIHGGHVSIGVDSIVIGFNHVGIHLIPHKKHLAGMYKYEKLKNFVKDTVASKYTTFKIPLTNEQYDKLKYILGAYITQSPYDYAFFGMRCAAATYDVLSQIGLFPVKSRSGNVLSNFYPKLLRKKMFLLAHENLFKIISQPGKKSRKWEND
jgi:hypothetical protein